MNFYVFFLDEIYFSIATRLYTYNCPTLGSCMFNTPVSYLGGLVHILIQRMAILTERFHDFLQFLQANSGTVP
jgi:hypothetical protein